MRLPRNTRLGIIFGIVVLLIVGATAARGAEQTDLANRGEIVVNNATAGVNRVTVWSKTGKDTITLTAQATRQNDPVSNPDISVALLGLGGPPTQTNLVVDPGDPTTARLDIPRPDVERLVGQVQIAGGPIPAATEFIVPIPRDRTEVAVQWSVLFLLLPPVVALATWAMTSMPARRRHDLVAARTPL